MPKSIDVWRSGTGKVLQVGDIVYRDHHPSVLFKVKAIKEFPDRVEVDVWGGKPGRKAHHTYPAETLHEVRKASS